MAAAKKGKKTSKPKRSSKGKKKSGNSNFFTTFILILLVLVLIVAAVFLTSNNFNAKNIKIKNEDEDTKSEIVVNKENEKKAATVEEKNKTKTADKKENVKPKEKEIKKESAVKKDETKPKKEFKELKTLEGCWLSSEQGAFITIDQFGYRIDFSNVEASKPLTGNYYFENNLITFTNDGNECNGVDGTYRITFYKKNISLICKDDNCDSRRKILETDWEWIEL